MVVIVQEGGDIKCKEHVRYLDTLTHQLTDAIQVVEEVFD